MRALFLLSPPARKPTEARGKLAPKNKIGFSMNLLYLSISCNRKLFHTVGIHRNCRMGMIQSKMILWRYCLKEMILNDRKQLDIVC